MKTLFVFLAGYCTAELVSHLLFYFGRALPFTVYGQVVDVSFNNKSLLFYGILALIFFYFALRK